MNGNTNINYFGETDFRNKKIRFGIKAQDRTKHIYIIGKTGMGKSTLLENMAVQDIQNGEGLAFIDPHGSSAEKLLDYVPEARMKDVVYFAPFDTSYPISFNVMEDIDPDKRHLVVSGLMSSFKKIWVDAWSARMEYMLSNTLLALLEFPGSTLLGVNRMFSDKDYRRVVVNNIKDPAVKSFWVDEFAKYTDRFAAEATPAIQNKIGQFTSNPLIRNIIGQPQSSFDIREIMDKKKILIMNLSKGRVGEQNSSLLGGMLITKIYLAAMSRADAPASLMTQLPNFYFYVDEFQSFANETFADILSEARKYKLNLTIAHQYIAQMDDAVRDAVFGNVGTTISFRVGPFDAEVLEKVFAPTFSQEDIVNLGFAQIYLSLMVDGIGSQPFSAMTLPPIKEQFKSFKEDIINHSREMYATPRAEIEEKIKEWHEKDYREKKPRTISEQPQEKKKEFGRPRPQQLSGARKAAPPPRRMESRAPAPPRRMESRAPAPPRRMESRAPAPPRRTGPSPKLRELLERLGSEKKPSSVRATEGLSAQAGKEEAKVKEVKPKQETISLDTLKKPRAAGAPTKNLAELKEVLGKATVSKLSSKKDEKSPDSVPVSSKEIEDPRFRKAGSGQNRGSSTSHPNQNDLGEVGKETGSSKKPPEVPRKVLEDLLKDEE